MKKLTALLLLMFFSQVTIAESVIVTDTAGWKSVPITIDTTANTYTVTGTVPTGSTEYYYAYPGYRCFAAQRDVTGVNYRTLRASVTGGSDIYCYPVQ